MIEVKYNLLPRKSMENYFEFLVGKVYKILPLKEENCITLNTYLSDLKDELLGNSELLLFLTEEPQFISLLNIIQFLISNEYDQKKCKRKVFAAIRIIESINSKYFKDGE